MEETLRESVTSNVLGSRGGGGGGGVGGEYIGVLSSPSSDNSGVPWRRL